MKRTYTQKTKTMLVLLSLLAAFFITACSSTNTSTQETTKPAGTKSKKTEPVILDDVTLDIELADKEAGDNTKYVMSFLKNRVYGKHIITGIMDCAWSNQINMDEKVFKDTGYHTGLMGFDFMELTKADSRSWYNPNQVIKARDWWYRGGLVAFCWHWFDPSKSSARGASYKPEEITFRIPWDDANKKLDTESEDFKYIQKDLDTVAGYLAQLQKYGVVVIWRPMHEAAGNYGKYNGAGKAWFWWGAEGPEPYKALYRYMFDYYTKEKGLHNLIWLWNGQAKDWYPGDEYVDLVGYDIYEDLRLSHVNHNDRISVYNNLMDWCGSSKMACISEGGFVPATKPLMESEAKWLFYMIWNDDDNFQDDTKSDNDNFWGGTKFNSIEDKTTNSFHTDYQLKRNDPEMDALFDKMGVSLIE
ncbi:MAG: glycoside hydrolase family 26 protein [Treponema sp.]|nr:glycoside hydrolase family 26 protein [Treponema sp.]